ncbi:hypothetical protein YYC_03525 [Plasmodium yoelii 17X]|uniref:Uncharacterized protein n=1 Tax=Plasmodium yoelii 17X TaxID=1323249 RepID=V7PJX5_PLAYE|nr:hypothetical protein YYC_03525 [Plasmodium yoelii 17X]
MDFTIDKLYKIQNNDTITLKEFYEKHLDKFIGYFNYWNIVNNGLKCANLKYMHKFYKLANHICNTIVNYKINSAKSKSLIQNSTNYLNQYISLYGKISECNSYLHLLDNLKKKNVNFRTYAIKENGKIYPILTTTFKHLQRKMKNIYIFRKILKHLTSKVQSHIWNGTNTSRSKAIVVDNTKNNGNPKETEEKDLAGTNQGNSDGGSNVGSEGSNGEVGYADKGVPEEKKTLSTPGASFNIRPYIFSITLKGMDQLNKVFDSFLNNIINNVSIGSKKIEISSNLDDKKPESKDTRDGLPTPDDSLPLQEDSPQTSL